MDIADEAKEKSPENSANWISRTLFIWTIPFYRDILRKSIKLSYFSVTEEDDAEILGKQLEFHWNNEISSSQAHKGKPSLMRAINNTFGRKKRLLYFVMAFNFVFIRVLACAMLSTLTQTFQKDVHISERITVGTIVIVLAIYNCFSDYILLYGMTKIGMRMRAALSFLIYKKALTLHQESMEKASVGKVVNILASDLDRIQDYMMYEHKALICPLQLVVIYVAMWFLLGTPALAGAIFLTLLMPVTLLTSKVYTRHRLKLTQSADVRVKLMNEIISGIKVLKMYAWEKPFGKLVDDIRKDEIKSANKCLFYQAANYSIGIHKIATFASIVAMLCVNGTIVPELVFSCAQFLLVFRLNVVIFFPRGLASIFEINDILARISDLLLMKEVEKQNNFIVKNQGIQLSKVSALWFPESKFVLSTDELSVPSGSLSIIVGPVGSGKSTFLQLLLGEISVSSGRIEINGSVSYSSQEAWLFTSTIRNNIMFGQKYQEEKYKNVVKACNLLVDFDQLNNGDASFVGERGVSLSGGQKTRINLARAAYKDAEIYLFDDPLSAVDTEVGRKLFENCINTYLAGKTRLVVTHQLQYLEKADQIIVINKGNMEAFNSLSQLKIGNPDMFSWIEKTNMGNENERPVPEHKKEDILFKQKDNNTKIEEEEKSSHSKAVLEYIKCGKLFIPTLIIVIGAQVVLGMADYWLLIWTRKVYANAGQPKVILEFNNTYTKLQHNSILNLPEDYQTDVIVYTSLVLGGLLLLVFSIVALMHFFGTAARKFHNNMYYAILKAPMKFYNTYPTGRILNRFSADTGAVDEKFPAAVSESSQLFIMAIGSMVMIVVSNWYMSFTILVLILYVMTQKWYQAIGREIRHLEVIARSPVYTYINNTLLGLTTIRVNKVQENLQKEFNKLLNNYSSAYRLSLVCGYSFSTLVDLLCTLFMALTIYGLILISKFAGEVGPGVAGLAILQVLQLLGSIQFATRRSLDIVHNVMSIERIFEFSKIESEESPEYREHSTLTDTVKRWSITGEIIFRNVSMSYTEGSLVLNNINVKIFPGQKVGVVGRTGAGKSSLINVLFRLSDFSGNVLIDGIDTKTVKLDTLRKNVSIIPQDPVLFSSTVRYNLDPIGEYTDEEIWSVVNEVELKNCVNSLDFMVTSGGSNFSTGQKQLMCLARAILRKNKIAVLDEATANVDQRTDELIQETLKKKFSDCTIITIAHRLHTIIETDKILVMDSGSLVECGHPYLLLNNHGKFYELVQETGDVVAAHLKNLAYQHYVQNGEHTVTRLTDELIQETLKKKFSDCTIITIAHRLHTIIETDKILVMDSGSLVECGHPYLLLNNHGKFYELVQETGDVVAAHLKNLAYQHYVQNGEHTVTRL